jgi:hypothetical protein
MVSFDSNLWHLAWIFILTKSAMPSLSKNPHYLKKHDVGGYSADAVVVSDVEKMTTLVVEERKRNTRILSHASVHFDFIRAVRNCAL